jgi:hypothetical protein
MAVSICSPILRTIARHRCGRWSSDLGHSRCQGRSRSAGRIVRWVLTPAAAGKRSAHFGYADPRLRQARQRRSLSPSGPPALAELGPGRDSVHPQRRRHWPAGSAQAGSSAHSAELSFVGAGSAAPPRAPERSQASFGSGRWCDPTRISPRMSFSTSAVIFRYQIWIAPVINFASMVR